MAYLGNSPARSFISFERQVFTIVNSQTVYTLDHSVTNENDIRLVVNNIVQEPGSGKAYTASGTTLTLSAALVNGTDEMYCVFLGRATATNAPGAGSVGTAQLAADAVTNAKLADSSVTTAKLSGALVTPSTLDVNGNELILDSDGDTSITADTDDQIDFKTGGTDAATIDSSANLKFNSGFGSATTVYGVRAWVNFNGTGTLAIRDSGGVSSVTDVGTGAYRANFSNNMPDVNFTGITNAGPVISTGAKQFNFCCCSEPDAVGSVTITNREVDVDDNGFASADNAYVGLIAIR